jgi:hypothetical protein
LITGFFLAPYFPNARGSGIPQTKAALFLRDGYISLRTVIGRDRLDSWGGAAKEVCTHFTTPSQLGQRESAKMVSTSL